MKYPHLPIEFGFFRKEAILLLRKFYVRQNDHGKPSFIIKSSTGAKKESTSGFKDRYTTFID
jgi:hypothetical protein